MWQILAKSIQSANHPLNQDANKYYFSPDRKEVIVAVADGHGSKKCFRSNLGSKFAVDVLIKIFKQHLLKGTFDQFKSGFNSIIQDTGRSIHRQWLEKVKHHLDSNPFTAEEQQIDPTVLNNPVISYGTTLLGALITKNYIIYMQLGDGDILVVNNNAVTCPFLKDENLIANETYSLCNKEADTLFKFYYYPLIEELPELIQFSTDGYSNSFPTETEFQKTAFDYINLYKEEGLNFIRKNIAGWLTETTVQGSGDDLTVILVFKTLKNESTVKRETDITN